MVVVWYRCCDLCWCSNVGTHFLISFQLCLFSKIYCHYRIKVLLIIIIHFVEQVKNKSNQEKQNVFIIHIFCVSIYESIVILDSESKGICVSEEYNIKCSEFFLIIIMHYHSKMLNFGWVLLQAVPYIHKCYCGVKVKPLRNKWFYRKEKPRQQERRKIMQ